MSQRRWFPELKDNHQPSTSNQDILSHVTKTIVPLADGQPSTFYFESGHIKPRHKDNGSLSLRTIINLLLRIRTY